MTSKTEMRKQIEDNQFNVLDQYKDLDLEQLKAVVKSDRLPYAVCALNVTGDLNVGMMMRSASLLGAEKFIIYGSKNFDKRTTVGAQNYIDVVKIDAKKNKHDVELDYSKLEPTLNSMGYFPVYLETSPRSYRLQTSIGVMRSWGDDNEKPCLVIGNEGLGIPEELLTENAIVVEIEQYGVLRSLNAAVAASVAMYQFSVWMNGS